MPSSDNQAELNEQAPDTVEADVDAIMDRIDDSRAQVRAAAEAEERAAAAAIKGINDQQEPLPPPEEEENIVQTMAKGREHFLQRMRAHMAKTEAAKAENHKPPPRTERQQALLDEEMAAGRRAQARHQAEFDARPPKPKDPSEGTTTPVFRPGDVVPDPKSLNRTGFAAGTRQYGAPDGGVAADSN